MEGLNEQMWRKTTNQCNILEHPWTYNTHVGQLGIWIKSVGFYTWEPCGSTGFCPVRLVQDVNAETLAEAAERLKVKRVSWQIDLGKKRVVPLVPFRSFQPWSFHTRKLFRCQLAQTCTSLEIMVIAHLIQSLLHIMQHFFALPDSFST